MNVMNINEHAQNYFIVTTRPYLRHPERSEGSPVLTRNVAQEILHYVRDDVNRLRRTSAGVSHYIF